MTSDINREIYNRHYSDDNVKLTIQTPYDRRMIQHRFALIERYGAGRDVLDLGCGTGVYLIPMLDKMNNAVGVDISSTMLDGFKEKLPDPPPQNLTLVETDAADLPLAAQRFDFVFSYTTLYHVSRSRQAIKEVGRVLRRGGYAALELGNLYSLNTWVCNIQHKALNWAKPFHLPYHVMWRALHEAGLDVVEKHTFQLLPMYGAPRPLIFLYPLLGAFWKKVMGIEVKGRLLDDWVSGCWPLRYISFRHLFVCRRT